MGLAVYIGGWARAILGALGVSTEAPAERVFEFKIEDGKVAEEMRVIRVTQGDFIILRWTTDRRINIHLHGYDIEKQAGPKSVTQFAFLAYASGRFPMMMHGTGGEELDEQGPLMRPVVTPP